MTLVEIFFSSFIIAFTGAMMPGPMFTATMLMSSKKGFISGPLIVLGHGTLELLLIILLYLGFGSLLKDHIVMGSIGIIGGVALLWMSYEAFKFSDNISVQNDKKRLNNSAFFAGIITSLSNPYWIIWWITIGLSYIVLSFSYGLKGIITFYTGHILADLVWYSVVAFSFSFMKRFITSRGFKVIAVVSGIIFMVFSIYFIWFGTKQL
jgi:threonine/homoserine/homoserine lactone efflux protein